MESNRKDLPPLEAVLGGLDAERLERLLIEAVEQYSPSFAEEPAMGVFRERLEEAGISYLRQPVAGYPGGDQRANLILELGPQPPAMMWVGHVDTVPVIDDEEQLVHRDGDYLYGLGTSDMKSGCAAIVEAVVALMHADVPLTRGVCIALVVGEEEYGDGSEALLERTTAPLTVIGEPTGLAPCVSHYGYYECRLFSRGNRVHAALPERGDSAIHAMLAWLMHILEQRGQVPNGEGLAVNPREIRGGADLFVVAESCEAALDVHVPPETGVEPVKALIDRARDQALATHHGCQLDYEEVFWAQGYANAPDHPLFVPLKRAYEDAGLEWAPEPFRSHSDGSLFHDRGSLPVVCGPGRLEVAHTRGEYVVLSEVQAAARLYAALLYEVCTGPA